MIFFLLFDCNREGILHHLGGITGYWGFLSSSTSSWLTMHDLQDLFVCRPSLFCRKSILRLNEEVLFWSPGMQAMYCTGVLLQLEGIGSTIMGIALMIGMLVTPYAEEAFGSFGSRPVERMWWEVHTKIGLKGPRLPMRICSVLLVFYRFSWSQGLCGLSMLRYMKEHVAVALGIVAVIVVAIAVASKQLGLKYLTWMTCWFSCRYPEWLWISFSGISHVGLRRFFFLCCWQLTWEFSGERQLRTAEGHACKWQPTWSGFSECLTDAGFWQLDVST